MLLNTWGIAPERLVHNLKYSEFSLQELKNLEKEIFARFRFSSRNAPFLDGILQEIKQEIYVRESWAIVLSR